MNPMLVSKVKFSENRIKYPCFMQPKLRGLSGLYENGNITTREGNCYHPAVIGHILKDMRALPKNYIYQGELYCHEMTEQEINSAVGVNRKLATPDSKRVAFHIYDIALPLVAFKDRKVILDSLYGAYLLDNVKFVHATQVDCQYDANVKYAEYVNNGYEGAIYIIGNCFYWEGRTNFKIRRKKMEDGEFDCIDIYEGELNQKGDGKYVNATGGLVLRTKHGVLFHAGSGLSDQQRLDFWNDPSLVIGKKVKVKFEKYSKDGCPLKPVVLCVL